jgi:hypothetical protein
MALIVCGCVLSGYFAPHAEQHYALHTLLYDLARPIFLAYLAVMAAVFLALLLGARARRRVAVRRVCAAALPGALVGLCNVFAKGASGLVGGGLSHGHWEFLRHPAACAPRRHPPTTTTGYLQPSC